jgi:hypothetical protein
MSLGLVGKGVDMVSRLDYTTQLTDVPWFVEVVGRW